MDPPVTFGGWLFQSRKELGLTRQELAGRIGCSVSTLRKIEDAERRPSVQIADLIANCLNIPPEQRSTFVRVARGELTVDRLLPESRAAAPPNLAPPTTSLPIFPTPLIGRERELAQLCELLHDPHCRLLTLVGPGGIGKTRLAVEVASRVPDAFADGTYFVPLASVNSTRFIVPVIAQAIGFAFEPSSRYDPKTQLFGYLKEKQVLLLADNLEQLLGEPGIELLADLLGHAPKGKLVATSREALGLQDEWIVEVKGLPIPGGIYAEASARDTSAEVFLQRARRAHAGFNATPGDYTQIVRVCQLVEGNPLGIELAAAWVRTLSCDEIAREIERGLDFLSVSTRDLPARHRSMRAIFDHSWKLLAEDERRALLRLSVFRGGFRREAAEAVAGASLSVLSTLVTKSLIRRSGGGRYDLHELIRQFAAKQLAERPDEETAARAFHSSYYLTHFSQARGRLHSSFQREALAELTAEMDNFRSAWEWAIAHLDLALVCEVSPALWYLFELRCWLAEGENMFRKAAETIEARAAELEPDRDARTAIHVMRAHSGFFAFRQGKSLTSYAVLSPSAQSLESSPDQLAASYALWYLAIVCWELGRFEEANARLQVSLEKAQKAGDRYYEAAAKEFLGIIAHDQGQYAIARRHLTEALATAREMGDPMAISHIAGYLGVTTMVLGDLVEAESLLRASLAIAQEIDYRSGIGNALDLLGLLTQVTKPEEARALFAASCDVFRDSGDLRNLLRVLNHQAYNMLSLGDATAAQESFSRVLRLAREGGYMSFALDALLGLATLRAEHRSDEHAARLVYYVLQHPSTPHDAKSRAEGLRADLEARLTPTQIQVAQAQAQKQSFDQAVSEFLGPPFSMEVPLARLS